MTSPRFTHENSAGYTDAELASMNAAFDAEVRRRASDLEILPVAWRTAYLDDLAEEIAAEACP